MMVKAQERRSIEELSKSVYGRFDVLGDTRKKRFSDVTSAELVKIIEIGNQGIGELDAEFKRNLDLDFESQNYCFQIDMMKKHLQQQIDSCKAEMKKRGLE